MADRDHPNRDLPDPDHRDPGHDDHGDPGLDDQDDPGHGFAAARRLRAYRARLVSQVASAAVTIDDLLAEQAAGGPAITVKVVVLAEKVPGVGKVRARRAMDRLGIPEDARWGEIDSVRLRALWSAMAAASTQPL